MAKQFVKDLKPGADVKSVFLVREKRLECFTTKPGKYLTLILVDKTGEIKAVAWERGEELHAVFEDGDMLWVEGQVRTYKKGIQVVVHSVHKREEDDFDPADFLPQVNKDTMALFLKILDSAGTVKDPFLRKLLSGFLEDEDWVSRFMRAPAAKGIHHAYLGGLLDHSVNVLVLCDAVSALYPAVNRDLLITGAILHDIGKMLEYSYSGFIDLTDEGRLMGHIVLGERMVTERIKAIEGFPEELTLRLSHMILSHHGEYQWGSPRRPKTLEACILHHVDNLDAKTGRFAWIIEGHADPKSRWTAYDENLERYVYVGRKC